MELGSPQLWAENAGFCGLVVFALFCLVVWLITTNNKIREAHDKMEASSETTKYLIDNLIDKGIVEDRPPEKRYKSERSK